MNSLETIVTRKLYDECNTPILSKANTPQLIHGDVSMGVVGGDGVTFKRTKIATQETSDSESDQDQQQVQVSKTHVCMYVCMYK